MLASWCDRIAAQRWRLRSAAFLTGALSILSMAPFFLWPILWLTLPALLWLIMASERRADPVWRFAPWQRSAIGRAAETGWWFGFGYHVFGMFWVGEAFLVEAEIFAWLLPFAVTLLPAGLALFTAAACAFVAWAAPRDAGWSRVLALAIGFGAMEWLRGHIFTGLPWNVLGYALTSDGLMQGASVFGIYGLTVVAGLIFAAPFAMRRPSLMRPALAIGATLLFLWAQNRLDSRDYYVPSGPDYVRDDPVVRIVQPSVLQREKWRPENQRRIFDDHLALSDPSAPAVLASPVPTTVDRVSPVTLIVWPEAAMPFLPLNEPIALQDIGSMLPDGVTLATGALRADPPLAPGERRRVYNSLLVFGRGEPSATVLATYDKTHLVPFGEYLPLQRVLEAIGLHQLSRLRGGFASGPEPRGLIDIPGIGKIAPLICYEAIFPGRVIQSRERPRAIVNVTNDGWFGNTTGPRQHLHMARVRAVEEGVPVIRAANNGISAVIDAYGEVVARLDLNVRGSLDARLPPAISPPLYARWGDWLFLLLLIVCIAMLATISRRKHQ